MRIVPRRCRWFGHAWVSTITGDPIDAIIGHWRGFLVCKRCGAEPDYTDPCMEVSDA